MSATFDPQNHLRQLRGKSGMADYLDVKWRLVWLRGDHPDAIIDSVLLAGGLVEGYAMFRATVTVPGQGRATAHGSETKADFGDYLEKAETKAIGRALAMLGYGTQFVGYELDEGERIMDSPRERTENEDGYSAAQPTHRAAAANGQRAPLPSQPPPGADEQTAPAAAKKRDDAPLIGWTQVWSIAHKRGLHSREDLARYLGVNAATLDPPEIYRRLTEEPAGVNG